MRRSNPPLVLLLAGVLVLGGLFGAYLLGRSSSPAAPPTPRSVVVQFPTPVPTPVPAPLPTREPAEAKAQDAAASRVIELISEVAQGRDPSTLPSLLAGLVRGAACPYSCERIPRLVRFEPAPIAEWKVVTGLTLSPNDEGNTTLWERLEGSATLVDEQGNTKNLALDGWVYVGLSRKTGNRWEPKLLRIDPPLVPERRLGAPLPVPTFDARLLNPQGAMPLPRSTDSASELDMPVTTRQPADTQEHKRLANEVLQSISTLAAGSPLPYQYTPQVQAQLQQIVSRLAVPGQRVTGLSLEPVEWERVEVRDENTLELVDPDDTAAMVGYLSGTVWLQDTQGKRTPRPLDPTSEHLVVNLHKRADAWVVMNVSDGKVDTHSPEEVNTP